MGTLIPFRRNKRNIRRLAKKETERLNELYRISAGGNDPIPDTDPEVVLMVEAGLIENPWREME